MVLPENLSTSTQTLGAHSVTISWEGKQIQAKAFALCICISLTYKHAFQMSDVLAEHLSLQLLPGECPCIQQTSIFERQPGM